jgi:hypothetical protein
VRVYIWISVSFREEVGRSWAWGQFQANTIGQQAVATPRSDTVFSFCDGEILDGFRGERIGQRQPVRNRCASTLLAIWHLLPLPAMELMFFLRALGDEQHLFHYPHSSGINRVYKQK